MGKKRKLEPKSEAVRTSVTEQQPQEEQIEQQTPLDVKEEPQEDDVPEAIEEEVEEEVEDEMDAEDEEEDDDEEEEEEEEDDEETDNPPNTTSIVTPSTTALAEPAAALVAIANADGDTTADEFVDDSEEPVQMLIEPLTKEQLIDLLREAADKHSDVAHRIRELADVDPVHRKIFVHGLGWDTNAETLTSIFKKYGEIEDYNVVTDKISGKSKGYGFILFKHRSGARKALKEPQKRIGNRMTACQLASAGPVPPPAPAPPPMSEYTQRKIYVSNVSSDIDPQRLYNFFVKYGEIEEGPLGLDKQTGKPKGFALFVYKSVESARKALDDPHKNFEGHILHCQKAIDGPKPNKSFYNQHHHHSSGGGRGSHYPRNENPNFMGAMGNHASAAAGPGHLMAPSPAGMQFNQGAQQALNPAIGQAITALLATQGAGLGLTNLLGNLGSTGMGHQVNQSVAPMVNNSGHGIQGGYGNQAVGSNISPSVMGGYGNQPGMQGGYQNPQIGQGNAGRSQQGVGHMGGVTPYMGH